MKKITKMMIQKWGMTYMDWMGYTLENKENFSYHHLIVPKRLGGKETMENGSILIRQAGHDYLHLIERFERLSFEEITSILIEINRQEHMPTKEQLIRISNILKRFEYNYQEFTTSNGQPIIKQRFLRRQNYED